MVEISDFADGEFYGSASISSERRKIQEELIKEIESKEYVIAAYGEDTEEYLEAKLDLEEKKNELYKQIELSCGFEELRKFPNEFEEDKIWKSIIKKWKGKKVSKVNSARFKMKEETISERRFREI